MLLFLKAYCETVGDICIIIFSQRRNVTLFSSYIGICYSGRSLESDSFIACGGGLYDIGVYQYNEPSKGQILPH